MPDEPTTVTAPTCAECGRPWLDPAERWRSILAVDEDGRMEPGEAVVYCPDCAEREFGDS